MAEQNKLNERKIMTELEKSRLEDFKQILTYRLVTKIKHDFKGNYKLYYEAPCLWNKWRNKEAKYDKRIYKLIVLFNQTALTKHQVMHIFGKDENGKYLSYSSLIAQDNTIKVFNKGTVFMSKRRFGVAKRYQLPIDVIEPIFQNPELLAKVVDAGSDYYTDRQRRLIFTQINKQKTYHYKTNKEHLEDMSDEEKINELMKDFDDII